MLLDLTKRPRLRAVVWTMLMVIAFSIPGADLPDVDFDLVDKLAHFALFAGFAWLWMAAMEGSLTRRLVFVLSFGLVLAAGSEIYQGLLPFDRSPEPMDVVADALGLLFAVLLYAVLAKEPA